MSKQELDVRDLSASRHWDLRRKEEPLQLFDKPILVNTKSISLLAKTDVYVILLWHLGDVLNSTALLPELAARHNQKLVFVTTKPCVPILENNPNLAKILVLDLEMPQQLTFSDWERLTHLSQKHLPLNSIAYNLHMPVDYRQVNMHIVQYWAQTLGIHKPLSKLVPTYFPSEIQTHKFRCDDLLILGNGGSTFLKSKRWPTKRWNKFIKLFKARFPGIQLVQMGNQDDPFLIGVEDLRGKTTIEQSYYLLKYSKCCLTNNSFLAHLAAASACPVFAIFGPTSPTHFRPLGNGDIFAMGGHRYWALCSRNLCRLTFGLIPCLAFPTVKEVLARVENSLRKMNIHAKSI